MLFGKHQAGEVSAVEPSIPGQQTISCDRSMGADHEVSDHVLAYLDCCAALSARCLAHRSARGTQQTVRTTTRVRAPGLSSSLQRHGTHGPEPNSRVAQKRVEIRGLLEVRGHLAIHEVRDNYRALLQSIHQLPL